MTPLTITAFPLPRLISILLVAVLIIGSLWYALFQARLLIAGPQIVLTETPEAVVSERQITIKGRASNITELYLNGRAIVTNEQGIFTESVVLENGHSLVRIDAHDRYGRRAFVERSFVYQPDSDLLN